ncbi:hypothetical protein CHS0354_026080 [Potamilus streckersoni]|uniref:Uncharacterized protein n=1 Tax=Potamilus streckersoni TaxID=2493646 RepID=A0AAE0SIK2_9BIVA|nr:hypothetical protein CHS0354_026080 [Potamilus streckersoni]
MRQSFLWIVLLYVCSEKSHGQRPPPVSSRHNHPTDGCLVDAVWYRVGQSIRQVHDGRRCLFIYCGEEGIVREWESYTCDPRITVQQIMSNQQTDGSFSHASQNIPPPPPEVSRKGPGARPVRGSWSRATQPRTLSSNTAAGSTVSRSRTPSDNIQPEGCMRGPSTFYPGDVMSERQVGNVCTVTYCDVDSRVQRVSRDCSDPNVRPDPNVMPQVSEPSPATDAPMQSSMRLLEDNLMALSLLNMLRR